MTTLHRQDITTTYPVQGGGCRYLLAPEKGQCIYHPGTDLSTQFRAPTCPAIEIDGPPPDEQTLAGLNGRSPDEAVAVLRACGYEAREVSQ